MNKRACDDWRCGWRGDLYEVLTAPNPFIQGDVLRACPECRQQSIRTCCDQGGCWEPDTIGTPTGTGYRRTCWAHAPAESKRKETQC